MQCFSSIKKGLNSLGFCFTLLLALALILGIANATWAKPLPTTYKEFKARYQTEAKTPEGALKMHFEAIFCYINKETRREASKMLRYSMYLPMPLEQSRNNATFVERMRDPDYNFVFRSFASGTSPENSYNMSPENFELNIIRKRNSEGYLKIDLESSGADNIRTVWLLNHDGLWYVHNNAGLYAMVREPKNILDARKHLHDPDYDPPVEPEMPKKEPAPLQKPEPAPQTQNIPSLPDLNTNSDDNIVKPKDNTPMPLPDL